ncbi:MAG: NAD-dependent epimerase/dehydratase family protein, partial [Dehalococcoidia bacterium]
MSEGPRVVAVTGAAGYVGSQLLRALESAPEVERLLAVDRQPLSYTSTKVAFHQRDVTQPLEELFTQHGVDTVVHLAFLLRPGRDREAVRRVNVGGTESVLRAARACGARRFIELSSHTVYGAHPDNLAPLTEEAPRRPNKGFQYAEDKAACEGLLEQFARENPQVAVAVLRCCVVMGATARNFITQALFRPVLVALRGYDPAFQFTHEEDLARLLHHFVLETTPGVFNAGGHGAVRYSEMARLAGRRLVRLPASLLYPLTELAWRLRLQNDSPSVGLAFIRYPILLDTERLREQTGFVFRHSSREALNAFL